MKKAPIRQVGAYERLSAARGISLASTHFIRAQRGNKDSDLRAGARVFFMFGSKPGAGTGFQEGNSARCGERPACAAGSRRATGPDPFVACGRDGCGGLGEKNQFTWEHASGELTFMR